MRYSEETGMRSNRRERCREECHELNKQLTLGMPIGKHYYHYWGGTNGELYYGIGCRNYE